MTTHKHIKYWLLSCAVLVFLMVIIGGLTRLTESGLSIVEWKLVSGILPPLTDEAWQQEFEAYQSSPQFELINNHINVNEFKNIFWLEYIHRLLGRLVGLVFLLPLIIFNFKNTLPKWIGWRMFGISALVGVQGIVGWYMVSSGLNDVPWVSPYRLAFHLGLAVIILCAILWTYFEAMHKNVIQADNIIKRNDTIFITPRWLRHKSHILLALIFIQIAMGALVAGLDAGLTYNTFPLMDGEWIPEGLLAMKPLAINFFENIATVQFQHRIMAFIVLFFSVTTNIAINYFDLNQSIKRTSLLLTIVTALQIILGIATLLLIVPIGLASLHQAVAMIAIGLALRLVYLLQPR